MTRVLVLGAAGMLGSMVSRVLADDADLEVVGSERNRGFVFDARSDDPGRLLDSLDVTWVINAIGVLKMRIDPTSSSSLREALEVNALFPHRLAEAAAPRGVRVIAIATDGVFSGKDGPYREDSAHDASDPYGQTKSLGEAPGDHVLNLRCSIIGPERGRADSILSWLLSHPRGARVPGYEDQRWNGITTLHFARLCAGILREHRVLHGRAHVVPHDVVTKAELLELVARAYGREDLEIIGASSASPADRSLATLDGDRNRALWRAAGHDRPPTIRDMVTELARAPL
jgi:dTDP-4-dehydrorhamnose reductase